MAEINHTGSKKTAFFSSRKTHVFMSVMSVCINPMIVEVNTGKDLACSIPNVEMSPLEFFKTPFVNSIFISPTTAEEIETQSTKLKCSKAAGPFSVPVTILKILKTVTSKPLEFLFNASFETGIVSRHL